MPPLARRWGAALLIACVTCFMLFTSHRNLELARLNFSSSSSSSADAGPDSDWGSPPVSIRDRLQKPPQHPVTKMRQLPTGPPSRLPTVQTTFGPESDNDRKVRLERQAAVKDAFLRCWSSYRTKAWMSDELEPVNGGRKDTFGGWGATLVDSLDTLWIMGLKDQFYEAVAAAANISFETTSRAEINVFETNIRYLGGFLAAYDLSEDKRLLQKAKETRWNFHDASRGERQVAHDAVLLAEIGSFSLEFIRLSMLTGDPKWFDAVQNIMEALQKQQQKTRLPGMWPVVVDARRMDFGRHNHYTLGAMADSLYEYLPKTHALVGGLLPMYADMYNAAMDTAIRYNLFRPMVPDQKDILMTGMVLVGSENGKRVTQMRPEGQHLACFTGGMLALGGKLVQNDTHIHKGEQLMDGCVWAYKSMPLGIMPEVFHVLPCDSTDHCPWDEEKWKLAVVEAAGWGLSENKENDLHKANRIINHKRLPQGFVSIPDARYILRPEAIESVFLLYRMTGRRDLPDSAWAMFQAIDSNTRTELANSALLDVTVKGGKPPMIHSMESFWLGETLKYFYLMFSEPDLINLDKFVLNTEAHPFKRLIP
ncbi:hypothetical protein NEUTE1DRAFT_58018 [Neurospora tetrasperma FGSC 2508]|uniref:alpha-1,2-Mannosidase n=1 Tax=Neurospora tetrasperma (strain FGSC 2508 / ATCC MYA-4615 / P0657) TaxID=510951 RepID=F8MAZ9_NEUT8|nr:uncharacterized protein NEUTE1DRAFT_58018 [Neurospora tetrasperma FGSC 2508]EGO61018.1 hypothetical protein NEUTE1DRAFT_58018 [Neurospora tetrasperma FGSC 2508]EGZ74975.1 seven-hairpin glycosidase [Neurospora tetrasperma FGSC 2509]